MRVSSPSVSSTLHMLKLYFTAIEGSEIEESILELILIKLLMIWSMDYRKQ